MVAQKERVTTTEQVLRHLFIETNLLVDVGSEEGLTAYLRQQGGIWLDLLDTGLRVRDDDVELQYELGYYIGLLMFRKLTQAIGKALKTGNSTSALAKEILGYLLGYRRFVYLAIERRTRGKVWVETAEYLQSEQYLVDFPNIPARIRVELRKKSQRSVGTYQNWNSRALKSLSRAMNPAGAPQKPTSTRINPLRELERLGIQP